MQRTRSLIRCVRWPASPRVMFRKKESIDMIRGEFIRGDGLVLPNNITSYGAELLLAAALQGVATTLHMCLGKCNPKVDLDQIGRASCREGVCQYVSISGVAVSLQKKRKTKKN